MSEHPFAMCLAHNVSTILGHTLMLVLLAGKQPITAWHVVIPHGVLILTAVIIAARMWCLGPDSAYSLLHGLTLLCALVALVFIGLSASIGPSSWVPFRNRPLSMALIAAATIFVTMASHSGSVPTLHPTVPHASIRVPLARAGLDTIRAMDTLTDASMIRLLWQQVGPPVPPGWCKTSDIESNPTVI